MSAFKCNFCDYQSFVKADLIKKHFALYHNGIEPEYTQIHVDISCKFCDKNFSTKANLSRHLRTCKNKDKTTGNELLTQLITQISNITIPVNITNPVNIITNPVSNNTVEYVNDAVFYLFNLGQDEITKEIFIKFGITENLVSRESQLKILSKNIKLEYCLSVPNIQTARKIETSFKQFSKEYKLQCGYHNSNCSEIIKTDNIDTIIGIVKIISKKFLTIENA